MDDTTQSRIMEASATRKRRSSILKSQRPPRTPFCELEFNVTTPTDVGKSRRVSFSRRTGIAEFATNEATTTWKNFYEEHNKSLESSGNDSNPDNLKPALGHLGKRIFDQQFEEVVAVDFVGTLNPGINMSSSINNINFVQQVEYTDSNLTVPKNKFELSAFTEQQSKLFGDELAIPFSGEVSDRIDVNFSAVQQIGVTDDLDEIEKEHQRKSNANSHIPFSDRQNLSEYIEIDLNTTRVGMRNEISDMSITDTIHCPKVQDVSKSASFDKKVNICKDWVTDKENIVLNPYITPRESVNFAINEEPDKVLVFDGKRLIVQDENCENDNCRKSVLSNINKAPKNRNTIINYNDDLPNFINVSQSKSTSNYNSEPPPLITEQIPDRQSCLSETQKKQNTILYDDDLGNMSVTQALPNVIPMERQKRRTILYENDTGNISITQAIPSKIIDKEKRQTIIYENFNISITQAIPTTLLSRDNDEREKTLMHANESSNISMTQGLPSNIMPTTTKRKTILYEDSSGNVSFTQAIPNTVINDNNENSRTIVCDKAGNISATKSVSDNTNLNENAVPERRKTVLFESETCNISVTQALPSNIIIQQKLNATSYAADNCDISMTQPVPCNLLVTDYSDTNRRKTVVYEDDTENLSITQAVPSNQVIYDLAQIQKTALKDDIVLIDTISMNKALNGVKECDTNKRRTVVFENDEGDVSLTQAVNLNKLLPSLINKEDSSYNHSEVINKRRTIVFENDDADLSVTEAVPISKVIHNINEKQMSKTNASFNNTLNNNRKIVLLKNDDTDISMTQFVNGSHLSSVDETKNVTEEELEIAINVALHSQKDPSIGKKRCIEYDDDEGDISMAEVIHENIILPNGEQKKRSIVFDDVNTMLENKNLFMECDKFAGISPGSKNTKTSPELKAEILKRKTIGNNDTSIIQEKHFVSPNNQDLKHIAAASDETANTTLCKPIPLALSMIENEMFDTSKIKSITKLDVMSANVTNTISDILVYQAAIAPEKGDSESVENIDIIPVREQQDLPSKTANDMETTSYDIAKMSAEIQIPMEENEQPKARSVKYIETPEKPNLSALSINIPEDKAVEILPMKPKDSILHDLLHMSHSSLEADLESKNLMTTIEPLPEEAAKTDPSSSNDTLFYITKNDGHSDSSESNIKMDVNNLDMLQISQSHMPIEYKGEKTVVGVQNKLEEIKSSLKRPQCKKVPDSEMEYKESLEKSRQDFSCKSGKSFKTANDTNELLEMLSDFTDKRKSKNVEPLLEDISRNMKSKNIEPVLEEKEEIPESLTVKGNLALENKMEPDQQAQGRLSFFQKRQSIALNREDFLNNLSMAGAALQKSRFELDDTDDIDDTAIETPIQDVSRKKSVRLSAEVVKTLHFDDDSLNETKETTKAYETPLKKTAFGEVSYMKDGKAKAKVIPEYLTEVSDGIKELMDDLVKPMADVLPFETATIDRSLRKCPSTCSTQIQANLLTSSQIDLNSELYSNAESIYDIDDKQSTNKDSSVDIITEAVNRSVSRALNSPIKSILTVSHSEKSSEMNIVNENIHYQPVPNSRSPLKYSESKTERVLIFDHSNPLNNILLNPLEPVEAHRYNPIQSVETICTSDASNDQVSNNDPGNNAESEGISMQYRVDSTTLNSKLVENTDAQSCSNTSKPSTDQWTDPKAPDNLKDTEVNTVIAMKNNKELLEVSSSLTLVDDALVQINNESDSCKGTSQEDVNKSAVVIYKVEESLPEKLDSSDTTSNEGRMLEMPAKAKKRVYSPTHNKHKHCTLSSLDVTPKHASKMQKRSKSPEYTETIAKPKIETMECEDKEEPVQKRVDVKRPGTSVTIQQVITMVHVETPTTNSEILDLHAMDLDCHVTKTPEVKQQNKEDLSDPTDCYIIEDSSPVSSQCNIQETASSEICSSLSSKNMRDDTSQISSPSTVSRTSNLSSKMDWLPESSSSGVVSMKGDTRVDIITKIDMMPFMGSHDCEWECSGGDTWCFLLLHSRLKLTVRFCPTDRVTYETRVLNVALETLHQDKRNTVALICVKFGAEMMRHLISRGCSTAEEVPKLVRKLAAAARLAARWARAMQDARARLAFSLTPDGSLSLKVANTSLRTVWEVTMRLEMQVEDAHAAPWPRACALRVASVLPPADGARGAQPSEKEVERVLSTTPHDWGHVPRTVWKIFKYLKHKRRDTRMILDI